MKWKPIDKSPKLVVVNCNMLAPYDEEKCRYCGRFGCTDRGYTLTAGDPPLTFGEASWSQEIIDKLTGIIENGSLKDVIHVINYSEPKCVRKLKKSNAEAVLEKMQTCGNDCRRKDNACPFRGEYYACKHNTDMDGSPLICMPDDHDYFDCEHHEDAFKRCFRRQKDGTCDELPEKLGFTGDKDMLLMLSHRFSVASCRFCEEGSCTNPESLHNEGVCNLKGLMAPCEHYAQPDPDHAYTEGVCTYVSSLDGKDDRKIFNTSDYAYRLDVTSLTTLCVACRISHNIAKATGLKCLGVRRAAKNPLLNDENPLAANAIQINYLYLTHPEDVAKYNPDLIAQAVYDALHYNCKGIGCEEIENCVFIK
jgi:hypothetical protein